MKKIILSLMVIVGLFAITGCGINNQDDVEKENNVTSQNNYKVEFNNMIKKLKENDSYLYSYDEVATGQFGTTNTHSVISVDKSEQLVSETETNSETNEKNLYYYDYKNNLVYEKVSGCSKWLYSNSNAEFYNFIGPIGKYMNYLYVLTSEDIINYENDVYTLEISPDRLKKEPDQPLSTSNITIKIEEISEISEEIKKVTLNYKTEILEYEVKLNISHYDYPGYYGYFEQTVKKKAKNSRFETCEQ